MAVRRSTLLRNLLTHPWPPQAPYTFLVNGRAKKAAGMKSHRFAPQLGAAFAMVFYTKVNWMEYPRDPDNPHHKLRPRTNSYIARSHSKTLDDVPGLEESEELLQVVRKKVKSEEKAQLKENMQRYIQRFGAARDSLRRFGNEIPVYVFEHLLQVFQPAAKGVLHLFPRFGVALHTAAEQLRPYIGIWDDYGAACCAHKSMIFDKLRFGGFALEAVGDTFPPRLARMALGEIPMGLGHLPAPRSMWMPKKKLGVDDVQVQVNFCHRFTDMPAADVDVDVPLASDKQLAPPQEAHHTRFAIMRPKRTAKTILRLRSEGKSPYEPGTEQDDWHVPLEVRVQPAPVKVTEEMWRQTTRQELAKEEAKAMEAKMSRGAWISHSACKHAFGYHFEPWDDPPNMKAWKYFTWDYSELLEVFEDYTQPSDNESIAPDDEGEEEGGQGGGEADGGAQSIANGAAMEEDGVEEEEEEEEEEEQEDEEDEGDGPDEEEEEEEEEEGCQMWRFSFAPR